MRETKRRDILKDPLFFFFLGMASLVGLILITIGIISLITLVSSHFECSSFFSYADKVPLYSAITKSKITKSKPSGSEVSLCTKQILFLTSDSEENVFNNYAKTLNDLGWREISSTKSASEIVTRKTDFGNDKSSITLMHLNLSTKDDYNFAVLIEDNANILLKR
jgi:hypothetical protein